MENFEISKQCHEKIIDANKIPLHENDFFWKESLLQVIKTNSVANKQQILEAIFAGGEKFDNLWLGLQNKNEEMKDLRESMIKIRELYLNGTGKINELTGNDGEIARLRNTNTVCSHNVNNNTSKINSISKQIHEAQQRINVTQDSYTNGKTSYKIYKWLFIILVIISIGVFYGVFYTGRTA